MGAVCDRCGATVSGSACDLCGGTRFTQVAPVSAPPPPPAPFLAPPSRPDGGPASVPLPRSPGALPVLSPASSVSPASGPRSGAASRKALLVIAGVLGVVLVGGAALFLTRGDQPVTTATALATAPVASEAGTIEPLPQPPSVSAPPVNERARCWDGSTEASVLNCTEPHGIAGVRYVYPEYDARGSCVKKGTDAGDWVRFDCTLGKRSLLRYRWWRDTERAVYHYTTKYGQGTSEPLTVAGQEIGTIYADTQQYAGGIYRVSGFFRDHFSFTVEAPTKAERARLLKLIVMRQPDEFTGYLVATGPREAAHVSS